MFSTESSHSSSQVSRSRNSTSGKSATNPSSSPLCFSSVPVNSWVIGDVHGCHNTLLRLIHRIEEQEAQPYLVFIGDLVGKGPDSLGVLEYLMSQSDHVSILLGNHDLHLLACSYGIAEPRPSDRTESILKLSDLHGWRSWLQSQDLILEIPHGSHRHRLVHAGTAPYWSEQELIQRTSESLALIRSNDWSWYKNKASEEWETVSILTRIRCIHRSSQEPEFEFTGDPDDAPEELCPWFKALSPDGQKATDASKPNEPHYIFGHWARLGLSMGEKATCIDSGCVYGGDLTAYQPSTGLILQVPHDESSSWQNS